MEKKENKWWLWIGIAIASIAAIKLWPKSKVKQTKEQNKETENITDFETEQAIKIKNLLGVTKNFGVWTTNGELITAESKANIKLLNLMLTVINWSKLQRRFSELCNNELTLLDALTKGLYDSDFNKAIDFAKAKKVITTKEFNYTIKYPTNTILGVYDGDTYTQLGYAAYKTIIAINNDESIRRIVVPVDSARLVTP